MPSGFTSQERRQNGQVRISEVPGVCFLFNYLIDMHRYACCLGMDIPSQENPKNATAKGGLICNVTILGTIPKSHC